MVGSTLFISLVNCLSILTLELYNYLQPLAAVNNMIISGVALTLGKGKVSVLPGTTPKGVFPYYREPSFHSSRVRLEFKAASGFK